MACGKRKGSASGPGHLKVCNVVILGSRCAGLTAGGKNPAQLDAAISGVADIIESML
jgi:hypothetical protein